MGRKLFRTGVLCLVSVVLLSALIVAAAVWRVSEGPVSLKPVLPIVKYWLVLPGEGSRFAADDIVLDWQGVAKGLSARATKLRLLSDSGHSAFRADEAEVNFGVQLVLDGIRSTTGMDFSSWFAEPSSRTGGPEQDPASFRLKTGPGEIRFSGMGATSRNFEAIALSGRLVQAPREWRISSATVDFGKTSVSGQAVLTPTKGGTLVRGAVTARQSSLEDVIALWPAFLAPGGRDWVADNMRQGTVKNFALEFSGRMQDGGGRAAEMAIDSVDGAFDLEGVTVHYFRPMPPIRKIDASARFDGKRIRFEIDTGIAADFKVESASVDILSLDRTRETIDIEVRTSGPVSNALGLLDHPALGLLSDIGLSGKPSKGTHRTRFSFKFPLVAALLFSDIRIHVLSNISDFGMENLFMGQDISGGKLRIHFWDRQLAVAGSAEVEGAPVSFEWDNKNEHGESRNEVTGSLTLDDRLIGILGLGGDGLLAGRIPTRFAYVSGKSDTASVTGSMDLTQARLELKPIGWSKPVGQPGTADVTVVLDEEARIREITAFEVQTEDLKLSGSLTYAAAGTDIERVRIDRFDLAGNVLAATIVADRVGGLDIELRGETVDVAHFLAIGGGGDGRSTSLSLRGSVRELRLGPDVRLENAEIVLLQDRLGLESIDASAEVRNVKERVAVTVKRRGSGHDVEVRASDVGALLSSLEFNDNVQQGTLLVTARREGPWTAPWKGAIRLRDFKMVGITGPSRLLALVSFQGIRDALLGQGVTFSKLDAPFELEDGLLRIRDARAIGSELGLTGKGTVDLDHERIDLEGMIAPAYTVNSFLGRIPLIGTIITGTERSGLVALRYEVKGTFENTEVEVDPLSILQPGIFRDIFGSLFRSDKDDTRGGGPRR